MLSLQTETESAEDLRRVGLMDGRAISIGTGIITKDLGPWEGSTGVEGSFSPQTMEFQSFLFLEIIYIYLTKMR